MGFLSNAAILIHTEVTYSPDFSSEVAQKMLREFAAKVRELKSPVYLCIANEELKARLSPLLENATLLPEKSEMSAIRFLFEGNALSHVVVFVGVFPLLDLKLSEKLFSIHTEYRADITYGENLPQGIAPYFVSRDLLESLDIMEAKDEDLSPGGVRAFVEKNINQFHAEVHYEEPDLRLLRLDFSLATLRSAAKTQALFTRIKNLDAPYAQIQPTIDANPELLATFPSYIELEFMSSAEAVSDFSPLKVIQQERHALSKENFYRVLEYLYEGFGDTSVCASGLGEPLEHPDARDFLTALLDAAQTRYVFVETNGIHLDKIRALAEHPNVDKLRVIVFLNSLDRYAELSGAPQASLAEVKANITGLVQALTNAAKNPQEIVYLQTLKVLDNENEIDSLYALAEDLGVTFLLQKYNRYAGLLPERRVSDMTPLERLPCWHLRRDLFIRASGDVALCKQTIDPKKKTSRGNLATHSLSDMWNSQRSDFAANYRNAFPEYLPCAQCDEYFTFNF